MREEKIARAHSLAPRANGPNDLHFAHAIRSKLVDGVFGLKLSDRESRLPMEVRWRNGGGDVAVEG